MEECIIDMAVAAGFRAWEGANSWGMMYPATLSFARVWLEGYMEGTHVDEITRVRLRNRLNNYHL
jgi:hypothetical protein